MDNLKYVMPTVFFASFTTLLHQNNLCLTVKGQKCNKPVGR